MTEPYAVGTKVRFITTVGDPGDGFAKPTLFACMGDMGEIVARHKLAKDTYDYTASVKNRARQFITNHHEFEVIE